MLFIILSTLVCVSNAEVVWIMADKQSPKYGVDLMLWCKVDDCCLPDKTKRWHGGPDKKTLMLNTGNSTDDSKYKTAIEKNGFMLVIKNLSPQDINVTYTCSYGFDQDEKMLSKDMVFHDNAVHKSSNDSGDGSNTRIGIVLAIVLTVVCLLVAGVLFAMYKTGKLKKAIQCFHREGDRNTVMDGQVTTNPNENDQLLFDHEGNDSDNCSSSQTTSQNNIAYSTGNSATSRSDKTFQFSQLNSESRLGFHKPKGFRGEYQNEETRKHSFTNWMLSYPSIDQMVEAGFFYLAYQTHAKCFYCGYSKIWCEGDDPLDKTLHKDCLYLEQRSKMPNDDHEETVPMSPV